MNFEPGISKFTKKLKMLFTEYFLRFWENETNALSKYYAHIF